MSKNRNRKKLNKAENSRDYNLILLTILYPPYDDLGWTWHGRDMPNHKWREYKTWKYNRKTKWKNYE